MAKANFSLGNVQVRTAILVVCGIILLILTFGGQKPQIDAYGIMIDAGSTGSRIHVYHFASEDEIGSKLILQSEVFHSIKPGLSSYAELPDAGAKSLIPLLNIAAAAVPKELQPLTPVNLKATAGLRLLPGHQADTLLRHVEKLLQSYDFLYDPEDAVEVMSGLDEGLFGWMTVNYLTNSIAQSAVKTAVMLDLGGGSTQIAMSVSQDVFSKTGSTSHGLQETQVMGHGHLMYLYSHLGYGLMAGRAKMFSHGLLDEDDRLKGLASLSSPCVYSTDTLSYSYGQQKFKVVGQAGASMESCLALAKAVMLDPNGSFKNAPPQPVISAGQPVFAMSYYMDRAQETALIPPETEKATMKATDYLTIAGQVCGAPASQIQAKFPNVPDEEVPFLCLDICYIFELLTSGFGVPERSTIHLARKLPFNGELVETQWPLGASLIEVSEEMQKRVDL